jgi:hypothetical protein
LEFENLKKICIILFLIFFPFLFSCFPTEYFKIIGIQVRPVKIIKTQNYTNYPIASILNDTLYFQVSYLTKWEKTAFISTGNQCFATKLPTKPINSINEKSIQLFCSQDLIYNNKKIERNTDLWVYPELEKFKSVKNTEWNLVFGFITEQNNPIKFTSSVGQFKIVCETNEKEVFKDSLLVFTKNFR